MTPAQAWLTVLGAIATVVASFLTARYAKSSSVTVAQVSDDADFRTSLMTRVKDLEERLTVVERTSSARLDYINVLEHHIWTGKPPPPPTRPPGI